MHRYNVGFPDEFAHPNVKKGTSWGIQAAKAIWDYGVHHCGWNFSSRRERFHKNELLAQGLQDPNKYKKIFGDPKSGKVEFMQMIWQTTSPLPKYIRSTIRSLTEQKYAPKVTALDATSQSEKAKQYTREKANAILKQKEEELFKDTPIKLVPKGEYVSGSMEEVELRKELGYKTALEIAQQIAIKTVLDNNKGENQKKKTAATLVKNSWGCVECFYDEYGDIKVEAFEPRDLIAPYSEDPYFENRKFTARYKMMTITEIRGYNNSLDKKVYTDRELFNLAESVAGKHGNGQWQARIFSEFNYNDQYNSFLVPVINYEINTVNKSSWLYREKPDGRTTFNKTKPHSKPKKSNKKELVSRERQVWYDGIWIVDSEKLLKHELRSNEMYDGGENGFYDGTPRSRFVIAAPEIYMMRNKAIPESGEPYIDNMHKAILKYQQFLNEIAPPAVKVNIDMMKSALQGLGIKGGNAMDAMNVAKQTRVYWYSLVGQDPSLLDQQIVSEVNTRIDNEIAAITELYNTNLMALESELGINDAMVGQTRNKYEGVGATELKLQSGSKALSHLQDAQNYIWDEVCKSVAIMVQDTLTRGEKVKGFENAIGKENVKVIKLQERMTLAELGLTLEMLPTLQDQLALQEKLNLALQRDTIRIEDSIMVEEIAKTDTKLAFRFMNLKQKEYEQQRMREAQNATQANSQQQQQSTALAAELEKKNKMLEHSLEMEKEEFEKLLEEKNQQAKHLDNMEEERLKGKLKEEQIRTANAHNLQNTTSGSQSVKQPPVYTGD